jgi:hypothetical protein
MEISWLRMDPDTGCNSNRLTAGRRPRLVDPRGLGGDVGADVDAQDYVDRLRTEWP